MTHPAENDASEYPEPDPLDERWFVADSEQWAEVVRLLERAPEPKPRLADLLRERGMFASQQQPIPPATPDHERGSARAERMGP